MGAKSEGGTTHTEEDRSVARFRTIRRRFLAEGGALLVGALTLGGAARAKMSPREVSAAGHDGRCARTPGIEFALEARVTVAPGIELGEDVRGRRRIVPITGGTFSGPRLAGSVLSEGEDTQVLRDDGVREIAARYVLRTRDGILIYVVNTGLIAPGDTHAPSHLYKRTTPKFEAPSDSAYAWLNRSIFIGTLERSLYTDHEVIVCFYRVT